MVLELFKYFIRLSIFLFHLILKVQFQAGFVAQQIQVRLRQQVTGGDSEWSVCMEEELDDGHELQTIALPTPKRASIEGDSSSNYCSALQLVLDDCTDFYGRITIYQIQIWGHETDESEAS